MLRQQWAIQGVGYLSLSLSLVIYIYVVYIYIYVCSYTVNCNILETRGPSEPDNAVMVSQAILRRNVDFFYAI